MEHFIILLLVLLPPLLLFPNVCQGCAQCARPAFSTSVAFKSNFKSPISPPMMTLLASPPTPPPPPPPTPDPDPTKTLLIGLINAYKSNISPVLPKACRFLPTCSSYGLDALDQFGTTKGFILIAWRIIRCNPFGGRGYDPPVWPPPPYNFKSY